MNVFDYCNYVSKDIDRLKKSRLLIAPDWADKQELRKFYNNLDNCEFIKISDCVANNEFLPSGTRIVAELLEKIQLSNKLGKIGIILGFDSFLLLWSTDNIKSAYIALQKLLDDAKLQFILLSECFSEIALDVFRHPKYSETKTILRIGNSSCNEYGKRKICFVGKEWSSNEGAIYYQTIKGFIQEFEQDSIPFNYKLHITIGFNGQPLAGLNPSVEQVYSVASYLKVFCDFTGNLSIKSQEFLHKKIKEAKYSGEVIPFIQKNYFPGDEFSDKAKKQALKVMFHATKEEKEIIFWLLRETLLEQHSYLSLVLNDKNITYENFIRYYICQAINLMIDEGDIARFALERQIAIKETGVCLLDTEILYFIEETKYELNEKVIPWLNNQTFSEKYEIIRRIMKSESANIPQCATLSYPLLRCYLDEYQLGNYELNEYFNLYRKQKIKNYVLENFYEKVKNINYPPDAITSRDALLQQYVKNKNNILVLVDALGAEYIPLIIALAKQRALDIERIEVAYAKLPTSTEFNKITWDTNRLSELKKMDNIIHDGSDEHLKKTIEENFVALLEVFEGNIIPEISKKLASAERVILTSDHGASRLAVCAYNQRLAKTTPFKGNIDDWRYVKQNNETQPDNTIGNLANTHWIIKGYDRFTKQGGKIHELHGGATLEEILVPFIVFKRGAKFEPKKNYSNNKSEFLENDDFDL